MKRAKVQSLGSLREQMKAVARGERPAPADAGTLGELFEALPRFRANGGKQRPDHLILGARRQACLGRSDSPIGGRDTCDW